MRQTQLFTETATFLIPVGLSKRIYHLAHADGQPVCGNKAVTPIDFRQSNIKPDRMKCCQHCLHSERRAVEVDDIGAAREDDDMVRQVLKVGGDNASALSGQDIKELRGNRLKVYRLLLDGKWHTRSELERVGGREATRRARELRDYGIDLQVIRNPNRRREFFYRIKT